MADTIEDRIRRNREQVGRPRARMMEDATPEQRGVEPDAEELAERMETLALRERLAARNADEVRRDAEKGADIRLEVAMGKPVAPARPKPAPAAAPKEQGILPGEEQVTTQDTFLLLPPDARMNLRVAHAKSGHADTMTFGDWLGANFSDLPPQQRVNSMREVANRGPTPMVAAQGNAATKAERALAEKKERLRQLGMMEPRDMARTGELQRGPAELEALQRAVDAERTGAPAPQGSPIPPPAAGPRQVTPEQQARIAARRQEQYAREVGNRYAGMLTADEEQAIDSAATAPGGMDFLRRLNADLQRRYQRDRHTQVRDRATNYNLSQDLRNPNYAPGMGVRSLIEAVRSGNSEMAGAVYDIYGNPVAGGQSRQLAGVRARAAADQQAAQIEADNALQVAAMRNSGSGDNEDPLKMEVLSRELDRALANPDPVRRHQAVRTVIAMNPTNAGMDAATLEAEVQRTIASHMAQSGSPEGRQHALKYLDALKGNKDQYMSFAVYSLRIPPEAAEQMYNEAAKPRSWRDAGRAVGSAAGSAVPAAKAAASGFGAGLAEGWRGK